MWDPRRDSWAAGFIDGEGSFIITKVGRDFLGPRFAMSLRADEAPVVRRLRDAFGGSASFTAQRRSKPLVHWTISSRDDLARLCAYLDAFPLRAKKARDYEIWREAVASFCSARTASVQEEMRALQAALGRAREYVDALTAVAAPPNATAIAARVGVDPSTVSRALRGSSLVAEVTRDRILAAASEVAAESAPRLRLIG